MKKTGLNLNTSFIKRALALKIELDSIRHEFMPRGGKDVLASKYRQPGKEDAVRHSAVALYLRQPQGQEPSILLTQRAFHLTHHKGQLSFPGGRIEAGEGAVDAAIRETFEEVGLTLSDHLLMGELSPLYVFGSRNWLRTFVFFDEMADESLELKIDPNEVEKAFFIPLSHLQEVKSRAEVTMDFAGEKRVVPHWKIPQTNTPLWGATALILNELLVRLDEAAFLNTI